MQCNHLLRTVAPGCDTALNSITFSLYCEESLGSTVVCAVRGSQSLCYMAQLLLNHSLDGTARAFEWNLGDMVLCSDASNLCICNVYVCLLVLVHGAA